MLYFTNEGEVKNTPEIDMGGSRPGNAAIRRLLDEIFKEELPEGLPPLEVNHRDETKDSARVNSKH